MAANDKQKIVVLDIAANSQALIEARLAAGNVIECMVSLAPVLNKLLIVYAIPEIP